MAAAASNESSVITLRGSTDIIVDFFQHAITCILYQRGIYPPEDFERASKYGLALHVAKEEGLVAYIQNVLAQLKGACRACLVCPCSCLCVWLCCRGGERYSSTRRPPVTTTH